MKSLTATGLFLLLLYHLIGLPLAVFTFEKGFDVATPISPADEFRVVKLPISLPYANDWENPDGRAGLIKDGDRFYNVVHQRYANDTLYTVLKTNRNARERFFDLADQLQQFNSDQSTPTSPLGQLLKLLKDRLTTYLLPVAWQLAPPTFTTLTAAAGFGPPSLAQYGVALSQHSPPPEQ